MLKNITRALSLSLLVITPLFAKTDFSPINLSEEMLEKYGAGFASLEHKNLGDLIDLHIPDTSSPHPILTLPNGIRLSYGEIVMYGGDLFGTPSQTISSCAVDKQGSCFKAQFDALALTGTKNDRRCSNPINQIAALKNYTQQLEHDLETARQNGIEDWVFYKDQDDEMTKNLNTLTCGGSIISRLIPFGNYIKLAQSNFDHFAPDSLTAYKAGHRYALETAYKGYLKNKAGYHEEAIQLLVLAYAQNAFANHYLTDSFSAGHMRTPRRAIDEGVNLPAVLKLILANLMHDEDNKNGLNVVNAEGTSWMAYGDDYLLNSNADLQKMVILEAMQRSANGIYKTFSSGFIPLVYSEMSLFPDYEKIEQLNQTAPLFKVENGVVLKRINNQDINDARWTANWSGLITLIEFQLNIKAGVK